MSKKRNEALVGMFVLVGFVLFALLVFFISGVYLFRAGYALQVNYDYVSILDKGAPVRMAGVRVGEVSAVELLEDPANKRMRVKVRLFIKEGIRIRKNFAFKIQGTHVLSEPHIEITPAPGEEPVLEPNTTIEGVSPLPVENLIERADAISVQLHDILQRVHETVMDEKTGETIQSMLQNLSKVSSALHNLLVSSDAPAKETLENLRSSTEDLKSVLDRLDKGQGTAGKLLKDEALYQDARDLIAEIKAHPWRLLKKDGEKRGRFLGIF